MADIEYPITLRAFDSTGRSADWSGTVVLTTDVEPRDPHYANVSLLLQFDQLDSVWKDNGPESRPTPQTRGVPGTLGLVDKLYGPGAYRPNTPPDFYAGYYPGPDDGFRFGTGDFTIEFSWVRRITGTGNVPLLIMGNTNQEQKWVVNINEGARVFWITGLGINPQVDVSTLTPPVLVGERVDVALVREGPVIRIFVNGIKRYEATTSGNQNVNPFYATGGLNVLGNYFYNESRAWIYEVDDIRITKGVARYADDYVREDGPFPSKGVA